MSKHMDLARVLRAGIKESPPFLPFPPIFEGPLKNLQSSAQPELSQISSVAAHVASSSPSFEIESSFVSEPQVSPTPATERKWTFSSSRFSSNTLSAETSESADSAPARATTRRGDRSRSRHRRHQSTARISHQELSPAYSSGITMAEKSRQNMARISERMEGFALGSPDSVVPGARTGLGPPPPRPQGAVHSEVEEEGEYVVKEDDAFGVVQPLSTR